MSVNEGQFQQQRLFPRSAADRKKRPGEMTMDQWSETQNPVYHATFNPNFKDAPTAHYGTIGQASHLLNSNTGYLTRAGASGRVKYMSGGKEPDWNVEDTGQEYTGRVYARRFTEEPFGKGTKRVSDTQANRADYLHRLNEGATVPQSISESSQGYSDDDSWKGQHRDGRWVATAQRTFEAQRALERGRPVQYRNDVEANEVLDGLHGTPKDDRYTSYVAPKSAVSSWERDVLNDSGSGDTARNMARQRIASGQEGAVPFYYEKTTRAAEQLQLPLTKMDGRSSMFGAFDQDPKLITSVQFQAQKEGPMDPQIRRVR